MKLESTRGTSNRTAKLTERQAQIILDLKDSGRRAKDVGNQFCVSDATVRRIWKRQLWSHLQRGNGGE